MDATFLCRVRLNSDSSSLAGEAEEMQAVLEENGYEVLSCLPWAREGDDSQAEFIAPRPTNLPAELG